MKAKPGTRVAQIAREIGVTPGQGYALAGRLRGQGAIRKSGKGYQVKE